MLKKNRPSLTDTSRWVVRQVDPTRQRLYIVLGVVLAVLACAVMFEFGRYRAGYDRKSSLTKYGELQRQYVRVRQDNQHYQDKIAQLETAKQVDKLAYSGVEETLIAQRNQIQTQQEELEFYRAIVSPVNAAQGLRIHDLSITEGVYSESSAENRTVLMTLVLARTGGRQKQVSGSVRITVTGEQQGQLITRSLGEFSSTSFPQAFSFKYFQNFEYELSLPADFLPQTVEVEVLPKHNKKAKIEQSFAWPGEPAKMATDQV